MRHLRSAAHAVLLVLAAGVFSAAAAAPAPAAPAAPQACTDAGNIGGIVFHDLNLSGTRQATETGINGVVLRITGPGGSAMLVTSGGVSAIPGFYATGPLCDAGSYTVEIVSVPSGYVVFGPSSRTVELTRDPTTGLPKIANVNFALTLAPCTSSIGNFVWDDRNANGIQDAGEPGIAGVTVRLYEGTTLVDTTTTDATGLYTFNVACSKTYRVEVDTPAGYVASPSTQGADTTVDSNGSPATVAIGANQHRTDIDFGFYALCQGVIGNFVWHDLDRDGVQDAGEPGLYRVGVELVYTDSEGEHVLTTYTDGNGWYEFQNVCPGVEYQVRIIQSTVPTGFVATTEGAGTTETDSNPDPTTVTLPAYNSSDLTIDFGFQVPCGGSIGDFVWNDVNANGVQDAGEAGLAGVQVRLYVVGNSAPVAATVTDANGAYLFSGRCGGDYVVEVNPATLPAGTTWLASPNDQGANDAVDSDGIGHRASVTLPTDTSSDVTIDFGYYTQLPLTASKTAAGSFNRTIGWTLAKTVAPASHSGQAGQVAGTSTWNVVATKTVTDGPASVAGTITVGNPNAFAVSFSVADVLNDGTTASVTCPNSSVAAGGSVVCTYSASPAGMTATLNTATVSVTGQSAVVATAPVSFTANVSGDASTTLADARFTYSQSISNSATVPFPETFTCPSDASLYNASGIYTVTHPNTATLTGASTNLTASASVTVTCTRQMWAGETATGAGTRYPNTSNWFMYSPYTTSKINLIAGQFYDAGDIYMSRTTTHTTIRIVLHAGWRWAPVAQNLKIQPFDSAPRTYVEPGTFQYKYTVSGNTITVTIPGTRARFYGIHGDVERQR